MAFGKRTDDVIGSVPNNPKLTKYIMMSKQRRNKTSDDENIVKQLDFKKEDLFDHFENDDENFLFNYLMKFMSPMITSSLH